MENQNWTGEPSEVLSILEELGDRLAILEDRCRTIELELQAMRNEP